MCPVDVRGDRRGKYVEHTGRYEFSSLSFPTPLHSVGPCALRNNMYINVYGVADGKEVIYPLRVTSTLVPDRHVDLLLFECDAVQHYTTIKDFSTLVLQRVDDEAMDTTQGVAVGGGEPTASRPFQDHIPCNFAYKVVSIVVPDFITPLVSHSGGDAGEMFIGKLQWEAEQLFQEYIDTP